MIDVNGAYLKAKKYLKNKNPKLGIYSYEELDDKYIFLAGLGNDDYSHDSVIVINKNGGKINCINFINYLINGNDYEWEQEIKIDNPDSLSNYDDINLQDDVTDILDFRNELSLSNRDLIFNLVELGESIRTIEKVDDNGITVNNINKMSLVGFSNAYGVKKKKLYDEIKKLSKQEHNYNNISIYALSKRGLTSNLCDKLFQLGIDKIYKLYLIPREIFSTTYNVLEATTEKIYESLDKCNFDLLLDDNTEKFVNSIQNDRDYIKVLKTEIQSVISSYPNGIKVFSLKKNIDKIFFQCSNIDSVINEMINEKTIELNEFGLKANPLKVIDFLNYLPTNENSDLLKKYLLTDSTFETLGNELGVSRERIRQKINKIKMPVLYEDRYNEYFSKYDFSEEAFCKIFDTKRYVYKYFLYKYNKGKVKLDSMLEDETISEIMRARLEDIFKTRFCFFDGEKVYKSKVSLLAYFMKHYVNEITKVEDIYCDFQKFIEDYVDDFELLTDLRDVEGPISDEKFPSLKTEGRKFKYYDINSFELQDFLSKLNLEQYKDVEYSTKYLFDLHKELMEEFNIEDEYVLHNLLRKIYKNDGVFFTRSPYICFGKGDRKKQVEELILEYAPISVVELCEKYSEIYGSLANSMNAYVNLNFGELISNQFITLDQSINITDEEILKFKTLLNSKEFWFKEDIYDLYKKNNMDIPKNIFNQNNLKQIGFINNSNYIVSSKYSSMKEYLEINFFEKDYLDLSKIDKRFTYLVIFSGLLNEKRRRLEIIEYENGRFMRTDVLIKAGILVSELKNFVQEVNKFTLDGRIFTLQSLKNEGFEHNLFDLGFDDMFYSSLIRSDDSFIFKRLISNVLFQNTTEIKEVSVSNLMEVILFRYRKMDAYDLLKYLDDEYGIDYLHSPYKLQDYAKKTSIYYDKYTDTYYYNYEVYYEEI